MKRDLFLTTIVLLIALVMAACAAPAAAPVATTAPQAAPTTAPAAVATTAPAPEPTAVPPTAEPPAEAKVITTWYQYDQNNVDPASDERVGNEYLRNNMPIFNEEFAGTWVWDNVPKAFDKMTSELVAAVQSAGEVPDIYELSNSQDLIPFYKNGTAQDLTAWAEAQPWFADLDPSGIEGCKGPDGKLYCVPMAQRPQLVYVWKDRFPDGYPTTPEEFLTAAEKLKSEGLYAMTFFGSTDKGGEGVTRAMWTLIASFGGTFDDGSGNMLLNTPENAKAIEFLRTLVTKGYVPEIAFAGGFQEEEAFKDSSAGSFPTGLFGYRYVNPLTAPSGKKYEKGNQEDMLDAIDAGDIYLTQSFSAEGVTPGCGNDVAGFVIPTGAKNVEGAYAYINWYMDPDRNAGYAAGPGGGIPVLKSAQSNAIFQTTFYDEAAKALGASLCKPWFGSLQRPDEAQDMTMKVIYKLIKEDPTADIAAELTKTQDEYNAGN